MNDLFIYLNFYEFINDIDYINLLCTSKEYYKLLDENMYKAILYNKFSEKFINKAKTIILSWKDCYLRIKDFEFSVRKYSYDLWKEDEYIAFWKIKYKPVTREDIYRNYYKNYQKNINKSISYLYI